MRTLGLVVVIPCMVAFLAVMVRASQSRIGVDLRDQPARSPARSR